VTRAAGIVRVNGLVTRDPIESRLSWFGGVTVTNLFEHGCTNLEEMLQLVRGILVYFSISGTRA
jgi:hypothetical protein